MERKKEPRILCLLPFVAEAEEFLDRDHKVFPEGVDIRGLDFGRRANESPVDTAITIYTELKAIVQAQKDGYDAVVVGCFLDPGVREARELVDIPVFGVANVSMNVCAMLAHKTGVITTSRYVKRGIEANVRESGLASRTVVRCVDTNVAEMSSGAGTKKIIENVVHACIAAIEEDDVGVLVLGCGGLYHLLDGIKAGIKARGYDIPVVESHKTAVEIVRALLKFDYRQSRLTYPHLGDYEGLDI